MANKIKYITDQVDSYISTLFYFKDIKFWGLSRLEKHQGKTIPVAYEGNSNYKIVGWNDKYGLNIYHRVLSISESKDNNLGFGKNGLLSSTISVKMVVTGNGKKLNNNEVDVNYKISDEIVALIPNRFSKATLTALDIYSLGISTNGRDLNKQTVYSTEFPDNEESKIKPSDIVFSIDYQVSIKSFDSCQTIACDIDSISNDVVCEPSSVCADATVVNSDATYSQTVASGGIHTLADITYRVYANGELISTTTNPAMSDYVINIED